MTVSAAPDQHNYRVGNDDGTVAAHTWISAKNVATRWDRGWPQRVRLQVDQPNATSWANTMRVHVRIGAQSNSWVSLPSTQASATTTTGSFWVSNGNKKESNGASVTATACGSPPNSNAFVNGHFYNTQNPGNAESTLNAQYTETEWNLQCLTTTRTASTFSFRETNNGTAFTTYTRYVTVVSRATSVVWTAPAAGTSAKTEPGFFTRLW